MENLVDYTAGLYKNIPLKIWEEVDVDETFKDNLVGKNPMEKD